MAEQFTIDEKFMIRALELAEMGKGNVAPNPMVGCVVVHEGKIIGEGYHQQYGKAHAEVNAIHSVKDPHLLPYSTVYVTLEPCSHFGKTPPCADLLIREKIPNIVIGTKDPFEQVAGSGIEKLLMAGRNVVCGILEEECRELNKRFFTFHLKKRPFIILKWAQTEDSFIDIDRTVEYFGQPTWITNEISRIAVHKMRAEESAILVGTNTARKDNPSLTVRVWSGNHPLRIVLDRKLALSRELDLFDHQIPTLVYTSIKKESEENLEYCEISFDGNEINHVLEDLYQRHILSLIVEGGAELLNSFISANLWDEAHVFVGRKLFHQGIPAPKVTGTPVSIDDLEGTSLYVFRN